MKFSKIKRNRFHVGDMVKLIDSFPNISGIVKGGCIGKIIEKSNSSNGECIYLIRGSKWQVWTEETDFNEVWSAS